MIRLLPTVTNVKTKAIVKLYFECIYHLRDLPNGIVSDRDTIHRSVLAHIAENDWNRSIDVYDSFANK